MKREFVKYQSGEIHPATIIRTHEDICDFKASQLPQYFLSTFGVFERWAELIDEGNFLVVNYYGGYFFSKDESIIVKKDDKSA